MPVTTAVTEELSFLGSRARILLDGSRTDARLGVVDMIEVPAGHMPPLHVHHAEDEAFYLLDGEVTLYLPGQQIVCRPGDLAIAPRGAPHAYRVGERPARWLVISSPAGFERFVAAVAALDDLDPAAVAAVAAEHDIEILGPPGMLP
jgi:quercetin dioxygenase-like cupin family protein